MNCLDDDLFNAIKGQTDSEHLFYYIIQKMRQSSLKGLALLEYGLTAAFRDIVSWQKEQDNRHFSRLNIAITDGHNMLVTKFASKDESTLSLYYAKGKAVDASDDPNLLVESKPHRQSAVIIASEPLTDFESEWVEIPENTMLSVDFDMHFDIKPLKLT